MSDSLILGDHALFVRRTYPVGPKRLWRAWTDPAQLAQWFLPSPDFTMERVECVPEVGGEYLIAVRTSGGVLTGARGRYLEVVPPERLVFTWSIDRSEIDAGESLVTVEFAPVDGGTELRVTHERLANVPSRDSHLAGWNTCLDVLTTYLKP